MKKLLVTIPFHDNGSDERFGYIKSVIAEMYNYGMKTHLIIYSNTNRIKEHVPFASPSFYTEVIVRSDLVHPFHLTFLHRVEMKELRNDFDYYMYSEDDMMLPADNFKNYIDTFDILWPCGYVPGLARIETGPDGKQYNTDATERREPIMVHNLRGGPYASLPFAYYAQWIMPQKALKESMRADFVRLDTNRELAASYPMWELGKTALVRLKDGQVDPICYTHHLPGNYAMSPDSPFGKIEINKILI